MQEYYTKNEQETAQSRNIVDYLKSFGYELKKEGSYYKGVLHNSLAIKDNGEWHWNSRNLHGKEPINLLSTILQVDYGLDVKSAYIGAIKRLAGTEGENLPIQSTMKNPPVNQANKPFALPRHNDNMTKTINYLCNFRCLDIGIVSDLVEQRKIYETKNMHNACFVSYDKEGVARRAFLRGTSTELGKGFKQDVVGSNKNFAFTLMGDQNSKMVYCFESDIDAISHASLYKNNEMDYKDGHRISLGGTCFLGLEQFLKDNPQITDIVACLDADETGNRRSETMCNEFAKKGYNTFRQSPTEKDFNEQLIKSVRQTELGDNAKLAEIEHGA